MNITIRTVKDVGAYDGDEVLPTNMHICEFVLTDWDHLRVNEAISRKPALARKGKLRLSCNTCPQFYWNDLGKRYPDEEHTLYLPGMDPRRNSLKFVMPSSFIPVFQQMLNALMDEVNAQAPKLPAEVQKAIDALDCGCDKTVVAKIAAAVLEASRK